MKKAFLSILFSLILGLPLLSGQTFESKNNVVEVTAATHYVDEKVTRVYVQDETSGNFKIISIESITFDTAKEYGHDEWRIYLEATYGNAPTYDWPSSTGWSYMSSQETEKYLICPTGNTNFVIDFPNWVTSFNYKVVDADYNTWLGGEHGIGVHSDWGYLKHVGTYVYGSNQISNVLTDEVQTASYQAAYAQIRNINADTKKTIGDSVTMYVPFYHRINDYAYNIFGYDFGGYYSSSSLKTPNNIFVSSVSSPNVCAKQTPIKVYLSGTMNNWDEDDSNYLLSIGDNYQFVIHTTLDKDTEFKVVYQLGWYGYSEVDTSSHLVQNGSISIGTDPDYTGSRIKVNKTGLYEIYFKTNVSNNRIWIQQDSTVEATAYATTFLSTITCTSVSTTFTIDEWNHNDDYETTSMEYMFSQLDQGAKDILKAAIGDEGGDKIAQAVARYDRILSKYGYGVGLDHYHDFMGRKPSPSSSSKGIPTIFNISTSNNIVPIIIVVSLIFGVSVGGYFLLRKREVE